MSITGRFLAYLDKQSSLFLWLAVMVSVLGIGIIDYEIGPGVSLSLSIFFRSRWQAGRLERPRDFWYLLSAQPSGKYQNLPVNQSYASLFPVWDGIERLGVLIVFSLLFSEIHALLKNKSRLSHTDYLTGISNRRALFKSSSMEIERLTRTGRPFTLLYMDLDDFKAVNDSAGHEAGDFVLNRIAIALKLQLRGIDIIPRMGGDEFVMILPETDDQAAHKVVPRLQSSLLEEMQSYHWPVTFSIGVLTFVSAPSDADEMFRLADQLMYSAKKEGKNAICYKVYSG